MTPRGAAAALVRQRAPVILPRVVAEACAGDAMQGDTIELQRRLIAYLERRIPLWVQALEADDSDRGNAIRRMIRSDAEAGEQIPPVVILGTVALGYRAIEREIRTRAADFGFTPDVLWAEMDLLRRTTADMRRRIDDGESVA